MCEYDILIQSYVCMYIWLYGWCCSNINLYYRVDVSLSSEIMLSYRFVNTGKGVHVDCIMSLTTHDNHEGSTKFNLSNHFNSPPWIIDPNYGNSSSLFFINHGSLLWTTSMCVHIYLDDVIHWMEYTIQYHLGF